MDVGMRPGGAAMTEYNDDWTEASAPLAAICWPRPASTRSSRKPTRLPCPPNFSVRCPRPAPLPPRRWSGGCRGWLRPSAPGPGAVRG